MPLTVHAAWLRSEKSSTSDQFFLWAEDSVLAAQTSSLIANRNYSTTESNGRQRVAKVPSHPTQVPIGRLRTRLATAFPVIANRMSPLSATVWLPTRDGVPLKRRSVFQDVVGNASTLVVDRDTAPVLRPWQVTGVAVGPLPALEFLCRLTDSDDAFLSGAASGDEKVHPGNDLVFWSNAAKFALEILVGQHYLPSMRAMQSGGLKAVWRPILLDDRVEHRRDELVRSMPPICRSYNLSDVNEAAAPAALAEHFVSSLVDAAVRGWSKKEGAALPSAPAGQWLDGLITNGGKLHLAPQPAHELFQEWQQWTEQLFVIRDSNFRVCFVLKAPDDYEERSDTLVDAVWPLHYFLQARDNPSLLVPARDIWLASNNIVQVGSRHVDQPQERLLAGLGVASRLFQPIEQSLRNPRPELALLSTERAYHFLREVGPVLESTGFGVRHPSWWDADNRMRLGLRLRLAVTNDVENEADEIDAWWDEDADSPSHLGLGALVQYNWELVLGDEELDQTEFAQLAASHSPLVRLGGRWVELEPDQARAAQRFLDARQASGRTTLLQAIRVIQEHRGDGNTGSRPFFDEDLGNLPTRALDNFWNHIKPPVDGLQILPIDDVAVSGWLARMMDTLQGQQPEAEPAEPEGFVGQLRPYQKRGLGWLDYMRRLGLGACLADDMGLGKTVQAIALLLHVRDRANKASSVEPMRPAPCLLICPTSVVENWRREIGRFAPEIQVLVHHGNARFVGEEFVNSLAEHDLVVTSYGTARRDVDLLQSIEWSDLILDEAQNIKTPTAKQTQAVRKMRGRNRIALTGTPVENRLAELWSIMHFLNPGYLGSHEQFRQRYIVPIERYNDSERIGELRRLVQPFLLRRLKSDPTIISDLPEKNEMVVYCSLTQEQANLYQRVMDEVLTELSSVDGMQRRGLVLALLTKLKQITNHPAHYLQQEGPLIGRSGKLNRMREMLEEALSVGDRALVFTQFVKMGRLLQQFLESELGVESLFLHGGTPAMQRDRMVQYFQAEDGPPVFILSLRAGGSGLNLTQANHVFHYDRWWNPAVENQATDRAFRIGQTRNVQVHKFVVAGTLEERIHDLIESKQALAQSIVGSGEEWITELDTEELRDLLMLRFEGVEDDG